MAVLFVDSYCQRAGGVSTLQIRMEWHGEDEGHYR